MKNQNTRKSKSGTTGSDGNVIPVMKKNPIAQLLDTKSPIVTPDDDFKINNNAVLKKNGAIEKVKTTDDAHDTMSLVNVNTTETLPYELSGLTLEQLVDNYAQIDQQSQFLKGLILLEARKQFTSNNDFGKWVESTGTLCSDTRQARTKYMNFAGYFKDKNRSGISLTCCYEISAPINADVADRVYEYALNKNLSVAQVKEQIQIAKGLLSSNVTEITEEDNVPELLPPEDIGRFKAQVLLNIKELSQHHAIQVLKECIAEVKKSNIA